MTRTTRPHRTDSRHFCGCTEFSRMEVFLSLPLDPHGDATVGIWEILWYACLHLSVGSPHFCHEPLGRFYHRRDHPFWCIHTCQIAEALDIPTLIPTEKVTVEHLRVAQNAVQLISVNLTARRTAVLSGEQQQHGANDVEGRKLLHELWGQIDIVGKPLVECLVAHEEVEAFLAADVLHAIHLLRCQDELHGGVHAGSGHHVHVVNEAVRGRHDPSRQAAQRSEHRRWSEGPALDTLGPEGVLHAQGLSKLRHHQGGCPSAKAVPHDGYPLPCLLLQVHHLLTNLLHDGRGAQVHACVRRATTERRPGCIEISEDVRQVRGSTNAQHNLVRHGVDAHVIIWKVHLCAGQLCV
mmetsp:Transcript_23572/g.62075  ORF Transcript_23572/g.62075 Transcript_23572/m.62075 type:complete len:352 (+) Transcript_23572:232-1287(+)